MATHSKRYLDDDELSIEQLVQVQQAANRGEPVPRFERPEYVQARVKALRDGGLEDEADELEKAGAAPDVASMSTDEIARHLRATGS